MDATSFKHRNQFYIVMDSETLFHCDKFRKYKFNNFSLFFRKDMEVTELSDGSLILGDFFSETIDKKITSPEHFLFEFGDVGGRWVLINENFLFTDFLASKSIFYDRGLNIISSSLGILRELGYVEKKDLECRKVFKYPLPPLTEYDNLFQLMPGQYISLKSMSIESHSKHYFSSKLKDFQNVLENQKAQMSSYTKSCYPYLNKLGYYQGLTGGTDSRLTLSSFLMGGLPHSTFTHKKDYLFMSGSDANIPKMLSDKYHFNHVFTNKKASSFSREDYLEHVGRSVDYCIGSNLYYFLTGQMELLKDHYFIDNYYETGARWMHGKGKVGSSSVLSIDDFFADGYITTKEGFSILERHLGSLLNDNFDHIDMLYFVKNFSTVANLFCEMDYYMRPVIHMNSRSFFSEMLCVPVHLREKEKALHKLIEHNVEGIMSSEVNKSDSIAKKIVLKLYYRCTKIFN